MSKPVCVIWLNDANIYAQALAHAGVIDRFEVHSVKMDDPVAGSAFHEGFWPTD